MGMGPTNVADSIKAEGNTLFAKGKYKAAIDKYTEAIAMCPGIAVLFVNRALCHKKLSAWEAVVKDARAALQLQSDLLKAHYVLGVALSQQGQHPQGISHLQKALEAAREQGDKIKDEIWKELARAKLQQYHTDSAARKQQAAALQQQLQQQLGSRMGDSDRAAWEQLFRRAAHQDMPGEVPSMFVCPLTMEVFRDPVLTPSGHSYERAALTEHLAKVGAWDPVSRAPTRPEDLRPNIALRSATQQYLDEHPWAWGECS